MGETIYMLMKQNSTTGEFTWVGSFLAKTEAEDAARQLMVRKPADTYYFIITGNRYG